MADFDRNAVEHTCARLLASFYAALDSRQVDETAALFAPDGVWVRLGEPLHGQAEIREKLAQRFPDTVIIHVLTNVLFTEVAKETASSRAIVTVFSGKAESNDKPASGKVRAVTQTFTNYELTDGQWRIRQHDGRPAMLIE